MFAVIRLRSSVGTSHDKNDTLRMLGIKGVNSCVLVSEELKDTVLNVRDSVTYGEIDKETLAALLKKRLRLKAGKRIEELKPIGYDSFEKLAEDLIAGKVKLKDLNVEKTFRLTPPSKGLKSVKQHYPKGDLGYRGKEINKLLSRMI